jgi:CheY-like chemotaxis protein
MENFRKNILLIDDDKIFNFLSEKTIASLGLVNQIHFATNGQQALDLLHQYEHGLIEMPDIIFLDLDMPIMNGYDFLREFRKLDIPNKSSIIIVVLTSSANPDDVRRAKELGIKYYFNKPLSRNEIKDMISQEFSYSLN